MYYILDFRKLIASESVVIGALALQLKVQASSRGWLSQQRSQAEEDNALIQLTQCVQTSEIQRT